MLALCGCVSTPLAPDPTIDPRGDYRVVAVNGRSTGADDERFNFTITPPTGSAQFGCNEANGKLTVDRGYVTTDNWIITAASCHSRISSRFERDGYKITTLPMAIERRPTGGIRLRNKLGSIDLVRLPPPAVVGKWRAVAIDGVPLGQRDALVVTIDASQLRANACNEFAGGYRLDGRRIVPTGPWRETEKECYDPTGQHDPMAFEKRVFAILGGPLTASNPAPDALRLQSRDSRIDFVRAPAPLPIVGEWTAVAFDGRSAIGDDRFRMTITATELNADFLCNGPRGRYRIVNNRIEPNDSPWPQTERGCSADLMRLDDRVWAVLGRSPAITMLDPNRMRLTSDRGSIDFQRKR